MRIMIRHWCILNHCSAAARRWLSPMWCIFMIALVGATTPVAADTIAPQSIIRISASEQTTSIYQNAQKVSRDISDASLAQSKDTGADYHLMITLSSSGSMSNIRNLVEGRAEFGIVGSDIANAIYNNPKKWDMERAIDRVRLVTTLEPSILHVIVPKKNNGPKSLSDLKNAEVSIGLPSAKTRQSIAKLFAMHDLPTKELNLRYFPLRLALRRLRENKLDAVITFDQAPNRYIAELLATGEYTLLSLNSDILDQDDYSDLAGCKLVTGSPYPDLPANFLTASVDNYLLVQDNVPPAIVTTIVQLLGDVEGTTDSPIPLHDAVSTLQNEAARTKLDTDTSDSLQKLSEQVIQ